MNLLQQECPRCYGYKTSCEPPDYADTITCPACLGVGEVPTELGNQLLDFLKTFRFLYKEPK